jgi:alanine racemase
VLVRGKRAPIVGRVCMDYAMIDVTHIANVDVGDEVVLMGAQNEGMIGAHEVAEWLDTSAYEVLTTIGG